MKISRKIQRRTVILAAVVALFALLHLTLLSVQMLNTENPFSHKENYTYISNHRDIIMDSAFLCIVFVEALDNTVEIAIGDNLLIRPWIKKLVRVNRSFIVQRSASIREMLASSKRLSSYMHHAITERQQPIWLAQREGRAKDSNDRTQEGLIKMLSMYSPSRLYLHIVPLVLCSVV